MHAEFYSSLESYDPYHPVPTPTPPTPVMPPPTQPAPLPIDAKFNSLLPMANKPVSEEAKIKTESVAVAKSSDVCTDDCLSFLFILYFFLSFLSFVCILSFSFFRKLFNLPLLI
jgi:hypothetical protein